MRESLLNCAIFRIKASFDRVLRGILVKVFISHQKADTDLSTRIAGRLKALHGIDSYLDAIDPFASQRIEDVAEHVRREMARCTQLLAVVSPATARSQWVPWEIGVATEKNFPLATFSGGNVPPPEFLRKWPYLRTDSDLDHYAQISKKSERTYVSKRTINESVARTTSTKDFYSELRAALGQR